MHVTDAGERSLEVRAMVSARSPGELWELRVSIREKLVTWLQEQEQGVHLPRTRLTIAEGTNGQGRSERVRSEVRQQKS